MSRTCSGAAEQIEHVAASAVRDGGDGDPGETDARQLVRRRQPEVVVAGKAVLQHDDAVRSGCRGYREIEVEQRVDRRRLAAQFVRIEDVAGAAEIGRRQQAVHQRPDVGIHRKKIAELRIAGVEDADDEVVAWIGIGENHAQRSRGQALVQAVAHGEQIALDGLRREGDSERDGAGCDAARLEILQQRRQRELSVRTGEEVHRAAVHRRQIHRRRERDADRCGGAEQRRGTDALGRRAQHAARGRELGAIVQSAQREAIGNLDAVAAHQATVGIRIAGRFDVGLEERRQSAARQLVTAFQRPERRRRLQRLRGRVGHAAGQHDRVRRLALQRRRGRQQQRRALRPTWPMAVIIW